VGGGLGDGLLVEDVGVGEDAHRAVAGVVAGGGGDERDLVADGQRRPRGPLLRSDVPHFRCPVPLTVRGTQVLVGFAPLAPSVFCAARQNAVLRRSPLRPT